MKNKDIFKKLNAEFDRITPEMSDRVKNEPIAAAQRETAEERVPVSAGAWGGNFFADRRNRIWIFAAAALVALALALTFILIPLAKRGKTPYTLSDSYITMSTSETGVSLQSNVRSLGNLSTRAATQPADINFSIVSDSDGKVVKVIGGNRESEIVLAGLAASAQTVVGKSVEEAVATLSASVSALGFYSGNNALSFSTISARGEDVATGIAADIKMQAESAVAGAQVVSVVSDKATLQASLGVTGEYSLEELLEMAAAKQGYLQETADELYQSGGDALYNAYLFELLEEYVDLLEDRQEAYRELYELYRKIKIEAGLFADVLVGGKLNPDLVIGEDLKEEFNDALEECAETMLVPQTDEELKLFESFYSALDFDVIDEILEEFEDTVYKIAEVMEELLDAVNSWVSDAEEVLDKIKSEWNAFIDDVGASGFTDPEDYIEKMTEVFEKEYEKLLNR